MTDEIKIGNIPLGATHERNCYFYKVGCKVEFYDPVDETWNDCENKYDINGWLLELTEIMTNV